MSDFATPNLPARDFDATAAFYGALGFRPTYRGDGWMILERGGLMLEFFPDPAIDPLTSGFGCCLRMADIDGLYAAARAAGVAEARTGQPRLHPAKVEASGLRIAYLVDPDGTLLRLVEQD